MTTKLTEDHRRIVRLVTAAQTWSVSPTVRGDGTNLVTEDNHGIEIIPYNENSEIGVVAWFAIHKYGQIIARVNGSHVISIQYGYKGIRGHVPADRMEA